VRKKNRSNESSKITRENTGNNMIRGSHRPSTYPGGKAPHVGRVTPSKENERVPSTRERESFFRGRFQKKQGALAKKKKTWGVGDGGKGN